ncbi:sorting nexin-3 [Aspergillus udagawae]|uniref:Sorting nexin-3 n=1 Tax=Aspergillus udagawae TaxID=91492 RepID=A0ABQ1B9M5_9EURO|nr:sorting nexin-3 [Aspergillus udagawae]GFF96856.1 sorting nexin-3 [Aspergillus udagawae]
MGLNTVYNHEFYAISNDKPYRRYSVAELKASSSRPLRKRPSRTSLLTDGDLDGILFMLQRPYQVASSGEGGFFKLRGVDLVSGEVFCKP